MDEAWALMSDTQGRALLERISRLGRSQNITPILATQMLGDAAELEPLVGALFAFGVETEVEARKALALLRLDPDDEASDPAADRLPGGALLPARLRRPGGADADRPAALAARRARHDAAA